MSESLRANTDYYDLCVVGAGYASLNALFVASRYLPVTARVLVLDKHQQAGGMWNDAYSYVRLHQPYRLFTAGNIAWTLGRERSYLATRDEVAAHLRHCFDVISKRLDVDARWGWECLDHTEDDSSIVVSARGPDGEVCSFTADRFIDATGFDVGSIDPLPLASRHVRSISPRQLEDSGLLSDGHTGPVWVIGSGKTAMDTIVALVRAKPARTIGMVTGTGTYFYNRDLVTPPGLKRWTGGVRYSSIFAGAAKRFDGTNAAEVSQWCRAWCGTSPLKDPPPAHLFFAFQSEAETATVATGVSEVIRDHLADVVDEATGPVMLLRTGARHPIPSSSWVVNCTGYLRPRKMAYVPVCVTLRKSDVGQLHLVSIRELRGIRLLPLALVLPGQARRRPALRVGPARSSPQRARGRSGRLVIAHPVQPQPCAGASADASLPGVQAGLRPVVPAGASTRWPAPVHAHPQTQPPTSPAGSRRLQQARQRTLRSAFVASSVRALTRVGQYAHG
jgi:hypothetical protein